jgi:hypothetical protein
MIPLNESKLMSIPPAIKESTYSNRMVAKNEMKNNNLLEKFLNSRRGSWPPSPNEPPLVMSGVSRKSTMCQSTSLISTNS